MSRQCQPMRAGVGMARELRLVDQRDKFLAGKLLVNLANLGREGITDVAGDLRVAVERRSDGLDLGLGVFWRLVGHELPDLLLEAP